MSRRVLKTVGPVDAALLDLIREAGYEVRENPDPLDIDADDVEGLSPVLLSDVGRYTARGVVKGLERDIQATRRFFLNDPLAEERDSSASEQELRALIDFSQAVSRSLAKSEIVDAAARFLHHEVAAPALSIFTYTEEGGLERARSMGLTEGQVKALERYLTPVVREDSLTFRQGLRLDVNHRLPPPPVDLSAVVPVLAKDALMGVMAIRLNPHFNISLDTLKAMGRQLALSLNNGVLLERAEQALSSLQRAQQSMSQSEKLAAVGVLAAGIAHEINNPTSFIITNLTVLNEYVEELLNYALELEHLTEESVADSAPQLENLRLKHDIDYLLEDTPDLISRSLKGMHRIRDIVQDLKSFAHMGGGHEEWVDINQLIAQVLKLSGAELRHRSRVELDLRPLPEVRLESTPFIQVALNLIINAYQAFGDRPQSENMVWVGSRLDDDHHIRVYVADNGSGMTEEVRSRIFEPFFTTKPVGTGSGLGLAVSYELAKKMGGQIVVESTLSRGTRFTIELPLKRSADDIGLKWRKGDVRK